MKRDALMGAVGALAAIFLLGAGTVILRNNGIEFPDTSTQAVAGLELVDSLGKTVGPISGVTLVEGPQTGNLKLDGNGTTVAFRHNGDAIILQVKGNNKLDIGGAIFFSLLNCEGDAAVFGNNGKYAVDHRNIVYGNQIDVMDEWWSVSDPINFPGECVNGFGDGSTLTKLDRLVDLDDLFTPPYHVQ